MPPFVTFHSHLDQLGWVEGIARFMGPTPTQKAEIDAAVIN